MASTRSCKGQGFHWVAVNKEHRIARLKLLLENVPERQRGSYLAEKCGSSQAYWSGMLAGDRSFGEKVARRVEAGLALPPMFLDRLTDDDRFERRYSAVGLELLEAYESLPLTARRRLYHPLMAQIEKARAALVPNTLESPPADDTTPKPKPAPSPTRGKHRNRP
jgi:hypothetical protein